MSNDGERTAEELAPAARRGAAGADGCAAAARAVGRFTRSIFETVGNIGGSLSQTRRPPRSRAAAGPPLGEVLAMLGARLSGKSNAELAALAEDDDFWRLVNRALRARATARRKTRGSATAKTRPRAAARRRPRQRTPDGESQAGAGATAPAEPLAARPAAENELSRESAAARHEAAEELPPKEAGRPTEGRQPEGEQAEEAWDASMISEFDGPEADEEPAGDTSADTEKKQQ